MAPRTRIASISSQLRGAQRAAPTSALSAAGITIDLTGKVAVITGATGQLGRTMVRTLAKAGADVAVHYRSDKLAAEALCQEISSIGRRGVAVFADIGEKQSVDSMHAHIVGTLGNPDIVVTNAVQQYDWKTVLEQDEAAFEGQFKTSVMQNVLMAKAFAPAMQAKKYGRIIAISTECAMQNWPTQAAYTSGKRGMDAVLRVLAKELGPDGITVNSVAPGWTISDTDRAKGVEEMAAAEKAYAPFIRKRRLREATT